MKKRVRNKKLHPKPINPHRFDRLVERLKDDRAIDTSRWPVK